MLFSLVNDSLESGGIVHSQVGEHLAVDLDAGLVNQAHQLCLLTAIAELAEPRYMSVGGVFDAYQKEIKTFGFDMLKDDLELDMIGLKGSPTNVYKSFTKEVKGAGTILTDLTAEQAVEAIVNKLEEKFII